MDYRSLVRAALLLSAATFVAAGCGNSANSIPPHSADEQKAIDHVKAMTPEQRIQAIQSGPMPQAAKDKMIKDIQNGKGG